MDETGFAVTAADTLLPFLLTHVKGCSRNTVKNLLAKRQILVDGHPTTQFDAPLTPGQTVTLLPKGGPAVPELPFSLLYEDEELIAIDKPAGLLSIATDKEKTQTAYHILTDYLRKRSGINRIFILHRLDRDTSGVLVFAKTEEAKVLFQENWDKAVLERAYLAIVEGVPNPKVATIRSFLRETATHVVYSADGPGGDAKEAITNYRMLTKHGDTALLRVTLDTGRKNQIRVHLKEAGHPVIGDKKYGAVTDPLKRMGLHALTLKLKHPATGAELLFNAPVPPQFKKYLPRAYREADFY
ncbi:MAG: RluA family pseudouridine synthase [Oscillospiraceae bacterium]